MCSRASRRVAESRSFWETACCELALGLEDLLLEGADPLGSVLEAAPEHHDLFLEALELTLEVVDLPLVLGQTPVVLGSHAITSWGTEIAWRRTLLRRAPASRGTFDDRTVNWAWVIGRRPACP